MQEGSIIKDSEYIGKFDLFTKQKKRKLRNQVIKCNNVDSIQDEDTTYTNEEVFEETLLRQDVALQSFYPVQVDDSTEVVEYLWKIMRIP